ncbi:FkbM family methyltransferase [Croceibacterium sp. TMG7-5b_MA50]|uniref:FkbM family methyltransferase n=1 Tax=Croceibacterium sp. TMG7-5b_MA50 TaxID=3121290 RepID=UPI003221C524
MISISVGEALSQGLCKIVSNDGWQEADHPSVPGTVLKCFRPDAALSIQCSAEIESLWLLKHAWSGVVEISTAGDRIREPLFHADEKVRHFRSLSDAGAGERVITLTSVAQESTDAAHCEVWLFGFGLRTVPRLASRSMLLNSRTRFIQGDWGDFLVLSGDAVIPNALIREGSWAPDDIEIFRRYVAAGDAVLDVGANFGHHSVVFSKLVGATGQVLAIEAQTPIFQLTNANAVLNGCRNIIPVHAAAGAGRGSVMMYPIDYDAAEANFGSLGVNPDAEAGRSNLNGEEVELWPVDELLSRHMPGRSISFVKIDVQAFELFVLQGMRDLLARDHPTIFTEISPVWMQKAGYDYREIYELLRAFGYEFTHTLPNLDLLNGVPQVDNGTDIEWDLLAVHPSRH